MAFPLLAVLGAVTISATALAWLYDQGTEREQERHRTLEEEYAQLSEEFARLKNGSQRGAPSTALAYSQKWIELLEAELVQLALKVAPIRNELDKVFPLILSEAKNPATDTFRRNMLKRELLRFDDAKRKLDAYLLYTEWFKKRLSQIASSPSSGDLLSLPPPSVTLPEFCNRQKQNEKFGSDSHGVAASLVSARPLRRRRHGSCLCAWPGTANCRPP